MNRTRKRILRIPGLAMLLVLLFCLTAQLKKTGAN